MKIKIAKPIIVISIVISTCFIAFIGYLTTNGFTNYVYYCSSFIPKINSYKEKNGSLPVSLNSLHGNKLLFWHNSKECSYENTKHTFRFSVRHGLVGVAFYSSESGNWVYD